MLKLLKGLSFIFGGFDEAFYVLISTSLIEFITTLCNCLYNKTWKPLNTKYFIKKIGYFLIIILAAIVDLILSQENMLRLMLIYFLVASDALIILKLWAKMGIPLPHKIFGVLNELKEEEDGNQTPSEKQNP